MIFNAIPALTYRLETLEKKYDALEKSYIALEKYSKESILNVTSELVYLKSAKADKTTHGIVITKHQKRRLRGNKRNSKDTAQRWAAWKEQLKSGMSPTQVATEWGCTRKAIWYAKKQNFVKAVTAGQTS